MTPIKLSPPAKIKALLHDKGTSAAEIGRKLGVSRVSVHLVISGKGPSARIREVVSRTLDLEPDFWVEMDRWRKTNKLTSSPP